MKNNDISSLPIFPAAVFFPVLKILPGKPDWLIIITFAVAKQAAVNEGCNMVSGIPTSYDTQEIRAIKEKMLHQHARVVWFTGLSGAGKTTLGSALDRELMDRGYLTRLLDGDIVRQGINNNLGFSLDDRVENIRRVAEVSRLFLDCGIITINCFITPTNEIRNMVRQIIGEENILEIYVNSSLEVCEHRDTKGLYRKARSGEITHFTGIDSPFEEPDHADLEIRTDMLDVGSSVEILLNFVLGNIKYRQVP